MKPFKTVTSKVVPISLNDVDTDMLIPAQFLTSVSKDGYGENLFKRLKEEDKSFSLNDSKYQGAEIMIGGVNFGCGSSREHAVWAVVGAGFKVVIAKSFADIFNGNSAKNGLLLVTLPAGTVDLMLKEGTSGNYQVTVSLEEQTVTLPDGSKHKFNYDPFRKHCLLEGLDDLDYIFAAKDKIAEYRKVADKNAFSFINN